MKHAFLAIALLSATPALSQDPNADIPVLTQDEIKKILEDLPQTKVPVTPNAKPEPVTAGDVEAPTSTPDQESAPDTAPTPEGVPAPVVDAVEAAPIEPLPAANIDIMKAAYMAQDEAVRIAAQEVMIKAGTYTDVVDGLYGKKTQAGLIDLSLRVFDLTEGQSRYPLTTPDEIAAFMVWLSAGAASELFK